MWFDTIITSLSAIIGVLVGARLARSASEKQLRIRLLAEFYADVFKTYTEYVGHRTLDNYLSFAAAAEKTMLLCSPEASRILSELKLEMSKSNADGNLCAGLLECLRKEGKNELGQNYKSRLRRSHNQNGSGQ